MRTRRVLATILILACAMPAAASSRQGEAKDREIVMSQGQVVRGQLRAIQNSRYIVQGRGENGENLFYDVSGEQIASVDGGDALPAYDPEQRVIDYEMFEQVAADGSTVSWNRVEGINHGRKLLTAISWGVADWEVERSLEMRVLDAFGNDLDHAMTTEKGRRTVTVCLNVPVAPGETYVLTVGYRESDRAIRDGDVWTYRFNGDFNEDRLLRRKVILPVGAEVLEVSPAFHKTYVHEGAPLVFWKRYYPAHEVPPMSVRYRLR